eukprot:c5172_g1_i2.p1 GENE.c5172_g1_i2~~c5172_g1_i2.p1  ORF type:complete len:640 (-),score=158.32 c5172_g1_i2:38-1957(-)
MENAVVKLKLDSYQSMVQQIKKAKEVHPAFAYVYPSINIVGYTRTSCVALTVTFQIEVLDTIRCEIPLLSSSLALTSTATQKNVDGQLRDVVLAFGLKGGKHTCLVESPGSYLVNCSVEVPYTNDRKQSFLLDIPECSSGQLSFTIGGQQNLQITCSPALHSQITKDTNNDATTLTAEFAPTSRLSVQWTVVTITQPKVDEEKKQPEKEQQIVTCEQQTNYSVGEGVLAVSASFTFTLVHASKSAFSFLIDERVRVLQVEGDHIKRWRMSDATTTTEESEIPHKLLIVELGQAVVNTYVVAIGLEMDMKGTSVKAMALPILSSTDVSREKGHFIIEARTNVEVDEVDSQGVAAIDVSEVPSAMISPTSNPLLAYKTLSPSQAAIVIDITKHQDTEVLVSAIDQAHFEVTVSAEGRALHRVRMKVRNTQQQYLRATLPPEYTIWTAVVGSRATKPALDNEGRVMIPLNKSRGSEKQSAFVVEIVFLVQIPEMHKRGQLELTFATLDIPVNLLLVTVRMPKSFEYKKTTGNLEPTKWFSSHVDFSVSENQPGRPMVMQQQNVIRRQGSFNSNVNVRMEKKAKPKMKKMVAAGVVPIKVDFPTIGTEFLFEKLLVTNEPQHVTFPYLAVDNESGCRCWYKWR